MIDLRKDWQEINKIAKRAKQYIIDINNTVKALKKFNGELNQIITKSKSE